MALKRNINRTGKINNDTGFGTQPNQIGGRFVNKDGTFNVKKVGLPFWKLHSLYSWLLDVSFLHFFSLIVAFYFLENCLFTALYLIAGTDELQGLMSNTHWDKIKEIFFFSTQTFTTVGYGRINPHGDWANIIASIESLAGLLTFALITGLLYGRFTRPKAYIKFSHNAVIAPYKDGVGLMFRLVPYKQNHHVTNATIVVNAAFQLVEDGKTVFKFYTLQLERTRIDALMMNWTVVHPIDDESPLLNLTSEDYETIDLELNVHFSGFDPVFSSTVMMRTSYTYKEIIWGAKFIPMYNESDDKNFTIVQLSKLNMYDRVQIEN